MTGLQLAIFRNPATKVLEAKATSFIHPVIMNTPSTGSKVAIDALASVNYNLSGITSLCFITSVGFEP